MILRTVYLVLAIAMTSGPAYAQWGAVAVNSNTANYGFSNGQSSKARAKTAALEFCLQFSNGQPGCEVMLSTRKCAAIFRPVNVRSVYLAEAGSVSKAGVTAREKCSKIHGDACELAASFCAKR